MRPTGRLHLGHYFGALSNWVKLQNEYDCFFFVADWHALTTHYEDTSSIAENTLQVAIDWLSVGLDPKNPHYSFSPASSSTPSCTCCSP